MKHDQYLRKCSLVVYDSSGQGIDLSQLQVRFQVGQVDFVTPPNLVARIYNLSADTSRRVQKEFTKVLLKAGYQDGSFGTVFQGNIKYFRRGRESATDTFLEIYAADSDEAFNYSIVNGTLRHADFENQLKLVQDSLKEYGVTLGYSCELKQNKLVRGKAFYGMARDTLRDLCASNNVSYVIVGGKLQLVDKDSYLPGDPVVLTSKTGMVGIPEQTPDGINIKCLLNPNLVVGGRVQIDNASINQMTTVGGAGLSGQYVPFNQYTGFNYIAQVATDGVYRILAISHTGETRGNEWYSDIICLSLSDATPPSMLQRGLG